MEFKRSKETGKLVIPKDNQVAFRHVEYGVDCLAEINATKNGTGIEVTMVFDPSVELTEDQKREIFKEFQKDLNDDYLISTNLEQSDLEPKD